MGRALSRPEVVDAEPSRGGSETDSGGGRKGGRGKGFFFNITQKSELSCAGAVSAITRRLQEAGGCVAPVMRLTPSLPPSLHSPQNSLSHSHEMHNPAISV